MSLTSEKMRSYVKVIKQMMEGLNYKELTPIQRESIPPIIAGKNVLIIAPTGYGKTEAALFPIIAKIVVEKMSGKLRVLYITPLRALNRNIEERLNKLSSISNIKVSVRHGDTPSSRRRRQLESPPEILITTPESLNFLLVSDGFRKHARDIKWVIIDEFQEVLETKRGWELSVELARLSLISSFQVISLSATIGDIDKAVSFLSQFGEIRVVRPNLTKRINVYLEEGKDFLSRIRAIERIVKKFGNVLVFVNSRELAEYLSTKLSSETSLKVATHHGSLSRELRMDVEDRFSKGEIEALVSTSSLELGIDIGEIDAVIQFGSPRQVMKLVQRVGRSGHKVNEEPIGFIIPTEDIEDLLENIAILRKLKENYLEDINIERNPLDLACHQVVGILLEGSAKSAVEIYNILTKSYVFKDFKIEELEELLEYMKARKLIGNNKPGMRAKKYYFSTSMISEGSAQFEAKEVGTNNKIGNLDMEFVAGLGEGELIVLGGKPWKVVSIDERSREVWLEQNYSLDYNLPSWSGDLIPVSKEVANEVGKIIREISLDNYNGSNYEKIEKLKEILKEMKRRGFPIPDDKRVVVEVGKSLAVIHSYNGTKANRTLGGILSETIRMRGKPVVDYTYDTYHIYISSPFGLDTDDFNFSFTFLKEQREEAIMEVLVNSVKNSKEYKWSILNVAKRMGSIDLDSDVVITQNLLKALSETLVGKEALNELLSLKYDLNFIRELRERALKGEVSFNVVEVSDFSPLSKEILSKFFPSTLRHNEPTILKAFEKRLYNKELMFVCIICGFSFMEKVEKSTKMKCKKCNSVFLSPNSREQGEEVKRVIEKRQKGEKLSKEEAKILQDAKLSSSLYVDHGEWALLALATPGIGPHNAYKCLNRVDLGRNKFLECLIEEEKNFLRNKKYWL